MTSINLHTGRQRRLHRIPSAVEYLNGVISAKTLYQWVWRRKIDVVRIGGMVCIPEDALDRLIESNTTPALEDGRSAHSPRKTPRSHAGPDKKVQEPL